MLPAETIIIVVVVKTTNWQKRGDRFHAWRRAEEGWTAQGQAFGARRPSDCAEPSALWLLNNTNNNNSKGSEVVSKLVDYINPSVQLVLTSLIPKE